MRPSRPPHTTARALVIVVSLLVVACGEDAPSTYDGLLDALVVSSLLPHDVLPGTVLTITGEGFLTPELGTQHAYFVGTDGTRRKLPLVFQSSEVLTISVDINTFDALAASGDVFQGTLVVERTFTAGDVVDEASMPLDLALVTSLTPTITTIEPEAIHPGDALTMVGDGFLQPSEGMTLLAMEGAFQIVAPPVQEVIQGVQVPVTVDARTSSTLTVTPDLFGILPGSFSGSITPLNIHNDGTTTQGTTVSGLAIDLLPPVLTSIAPAEASRGQIVSIEGQGFLPTDSALETTTLVALEGSFSTAAGTISLEGPDRFLLYPDEFVGTTTIHYVLRATVGLDGSLEGLAMTPGTFQGDIYPLLFYGKDSFAGEGITGTFTVLPQQQVVYIKYLPGFEEGLEAFGLLAAAEAIEARILEVVHRDYDGINIIFVDERPDDFVDYGIIEVTGRDPNDAGLLGLDNTTGKDVGNLRFNDVIGGLNAETEEQGFYAYGGVFVKSFLAFSPTISASPAEIASPRFDDIFGPFVPDLGGDPLTTDDLAGGSRAAMADEAIRCLGNLIGTTISHEIGHSLGLANVEGEYHNIGDNPDAIMDAGSYRPFEERCEIDGLGPGVFMPHNKTYLEEILPTP